MRADHFLFLINLIFTFVALRPDHIATKEFFSSQLPSHKVVKPVQVIRHDDLAVKWERRNDRLID
jgi:hypothetical protein